jgi:AraC-like DNA-binding protein
MDNASIPVALAGMLPAVCDAEKGQRCVGHTRSAVSKPPDDHNGSLQVAASPSSEDDPLARHGFSLKKVRTAIAELCSAIRSALDGERGTAEDSLRRAAEILQEMGETGSCPGAEQSRGGLAPWQIRKVSSYVDANLNQTIRNENLATIARLNASHFCYAFRNSFGEPPHEYVIRRRVERAQGLMLTTSAPLSAIALDCGLADQAHLSRLFRRVVGESPSAWRRARLGEPVKSV